MTPLPVTPRSHERGPVPDRLSITDREFEQLRAFIRVETGIDLREVKRPLLCARLGRRLRHHGYSSFGAYWVHLRDHDPAGEERLAMVNAITTNKTDFFREPHHFEFLRTTALPAAAARLANGGVPRLRVWSAACSTGEEPYSIAFTILDGPLRIGGWDVRILASDINTEVLEIAETGVFDDERLAHLDSGLCRRHFRRDPGQPHRARVSPVARALVTFRRINLCLEPWPIHTAFDVIFCRNVLIYFNRAMQLALVRRLVDFLVPGGYLVLGHSESLLGQGLGLHYAGQTVYQKPAATPGADIHA